MIAVLHITNWYPGPWNLLETPFIKAHFAALDGRVRQVLWHVQVREQQSRWRLKWGSTGSHEHFLVIDSRLPGTDSRYKVSCMDSQSSAEISTALARFPAMATG